MARDAAPPTRIQSVSRAARILLFVAQHADGVEVRGIAEEFDLSVPTTYHLINTLLDEGLLSKVEHRRYMIGPAAAILAEAYSKAGAFPEEFREILREAARRTGDSAYLSGWRGDDAVVLATAEGSNAVRVMGLTTGFSGRLHARASGKVLLAFCTDDRRERLLAGMKLERVTPRTITSKTALRKELAKVQQSGIAFDLEEFQLGVACLAVPLHVGGSVVAALTVSTPFESFRRRKPVLVETLREVAQKASISYS